MADYATLKVPDLKKLLQEKSLTVTGNKADLIARLQEHDKAAEPSNPAVTSTANAEDEIDWDEDDEPVTTTATTTTATTTKPAEPTQPAEPATAPATEEPSAAVVAEPAKETSAIEEATTTTVEKIEEAPKPDFSAHLAASTADEEARKRAERAKRFGTVEENKNDEEKRKADRAKRFGIEAGSEKLVKGLDEALPERRERGNKRDRDGAGVEERGAKRQSTDGRRSGGRHRGNDRRGGRGGGRGVDRQQNGGAPKKIIDPADKAKAEARAKRFGA